MTINLKIPDIREMKPRITVFGVGGAGGNAVNNMISAGLQGVDFVVANTDAQALTLSKAERIVQMGTQVTEGLGAGSQPEVGRAAAEEVIDELRDHLTGAHMVFVTAGMGGGTGTGAAPVIARIARELGILTVGVVTKPFHFEGQRRMRFAEAGIAELQKVVDTLLIIPNQNLFRVANEKTTFADAFAMADQVLYSGVACITDLMVKEGLINLDFADVRAVMKEMGKAMMGTGEATGEKRALTAAEAAIANPLIDDASMKGARGLLISITGGKDLTLYEVDEAATRIREEVDQDANIIVGATFDESLEGIIRVSVVATGIDHTGHMAQPQPAAESALKELASKMRNDSKRIADRVERVSPAKPAMASASPQADLTAFHAAHAAVAATTGLLALLTRDEIEGVMAHELGHVAHRDAMRQLIESAGLSAVIGVVIGDYSGSTVAVLIGRSLVNAGYSREAEAGADAFALELMLKLKRNPAALGDALKHISEDTPGFDGALAWLSTHPATSSRIEALSGHKPDTSQPPVLDDTEWAALKAICQKGN